MLRGEGITRINLDLVYGLPHQTLAGWRRALDFAAGLNPNRLAVFGYAHVPQFKKHQALIPEAALPAIDARLDMAQLAQDVICGHGYVAIGLDHFAKPDDAMAEAARAGILSRNFQGYTTDQGASLLGLGASSIGSLPQGYVQNLPTVPLYRPMIETGRLPIARGIKLSEDDRIRRKAIEELMCWLEVDLEELAHDAGVAPSLFDVPLDRLAPLIAQGAVERCGMKIKIPRRWTAALRLAASAFDEYLPRDKAVHSLSV